MKKKVLFIFLIFILFLTNVKADDVTNNFKVENARACSDASCSIVYDENNGFVSAGINKLSVEINWSYYSDTPINDGDTITIPFANEITTSDSSRWLSGTFTWSDITDTNGNKIGRWSVTGDNASRKMNIKLSDAAVGKYSLNGTLHTPNSLYSLFNYEDKLLNLTVGDKTIKILSLTRTMPAIKNGLVCSVNSATNNSISWLNTTLHGTIRELYMYDDYTELTDDVKYDNLVMEVSSTDGGSINKSSPSLGSRWLYPTNLTEHYASDTGSFLGDNRYFTEITQEDNDTYDSFKAKIHEMQYGIYKEPSTSKETFIVNFGSQPSKTYTTQKFLEDINPNLTIAQHVNQHNPYSITIEAADIVERAIGPNNIIGGKIPLWKANVTIKYPTAVVEGTVKDNILKVSYTDVNGNYKEAQKICSTTLRVPSSTATINKGEVKLTLIDSKSKTIISGATFSLQKNNDGNWEDFKTNLITDENGAVYAYGLSDGDYRFMQNNYLDHYVNPSLKVFSNQSLSTEISSFVIRSTDENGIDLYATNDREVYTIIYKPGEHGNFDEQVYYAYYGDSLPIYTPEDNNGWIFTGWDPSLPLSVTSDGTYTANWEKKVNLNVHHYISGTTTKVSNDVSTKVNTGSSYTTSMASDIPNKYEFVGTDGEVSGVAGENDIEVIYYYQLKSSKLIVNYVEEETGEVLASKIEQNLHYDDTYTTTESDEIKSNYSLKRIDGEVSGIVDKDIIEVTYYYEKKNSKLDASISKTGSSELTNKNDVVDYKIEYQVTVEDYIGNGNIKIIDTLPYKIDEEKSNLDGGVYDESANTITWNEEWNDIDSYTTDNKKIEKNIKIKYTNLDSTKRAMTNNVKAIVTLDDNSKEVISNYSTNIKIPSKIVVKYIDTETNKNLADEIVSTSLVGDDYSLETKEFEGYNLEEGPDSEVVKYTEEDSEYIYKYKQILFNISTGVIGEGGTIVGDEPVKYGEDSTKDKIKIKAYDNYYIEKILINGKEQEINSYLKSITLNNFKEVKENKEILVMFNKEFDNPKTGNNYLYYIVGSLLVSSIAAIVVIRKKKVSL